MREKIGTSLFKPKKAVCAERLHEALEGAKVKNLVEAGRDLHSGSARNDFVKLQEQIALSAGQFDIGVV
jgi:argininosuccinate lyase